MLRRRISLIIVLASILVAIAAVTATPRTTYTFESPDFYAHPAATADHDTVVQHGGRGSARLHRTDDSEGGFSTVTMTLPGDRGGQRIELRGWLKSDDVQDWFGLWLRLDGPHGHVGFDNMQNRELRGTTEWTEYSIVLPLSQETRKVVFGALLAGPGTLWIDDLKVLIDGQPYAAAPMVERELTIIDTDQSHARGSGFWIEEVAPEKVDHLALLGRVWGFLKYHHPAVTGGNRQWDFDLFRVLPDIMDADDTPAVQAVLTRWINDLGPIEPCDPCAQEPDPVMVAQPADLGWLRDTELLGRELSELLLAVHAARPDADTGFWVGFQRYVGNPDFSTEPSYASLAAVDPGFRLLALFRFWNIVQYWCPNRDIAGVDWPQELHDFIPRLLAAREGLDYERALLALIARLNDTHTQIYSSLGSRPPGLEAQVPVRMRWVEDRPVVWTMAHEFLGPATGLEPGDVVLAVDGRPFAELFAEWAPYYSASNDMQRLDDLANSLLRGPVGETSLQIRRGRDELTITTQRLAFDKLDRMLGVWHTRAGRAYQLLDENVAYMKLEAIKADSVTTWITDALARDVRGLVLDCRAYPGDFPIFELGNHLVDQPTPFVVFTRADPANPGAFLWNEYTPLTPAAPHFDRPVVILVDEVSQSSAEYHALAWRAAPQALVMGGTSSGADGNVSQFPFPGNLTTMISGIGVYDAQRQNTQRVGIAPDIRVEPTIAGLAAGRDEVLEAAVRNILERTDG